MVGNQKRNNQCDKDVGIFRTCKSCSTEELRTAIGEHIAQTEWLHIEVKQVMKFFANHRAVKKGDLTFKFPCMLVLTSLWHEIANRQEYAATN